MIDDTNPIQDRNLMQHSWLDSLTILVAGIGDRLRARRDGFGSVDASSTREHRAWAEGVPSDYDGPRDPVDSSELASIIEHLGD